MKCAVGWQLFSQSHFVRVLHQLSINPNSALLDLTGAYNDFLVKLVKNVETYSGFALLYWNEDM